jgi:hypothetical protein
MDGDDVVEDLGLAGGQVQEDADVVETGTAVVVEDNFLLKRGRQQPGCDVDGRRSVSCCLVEKVECQWLWEGFVSQVEQSILHGGSDNFTLERDLFTQTDLEWQRPCQLHIVAGKDLSQGKLSLCGVISHADAHVGVGRVKDGGPVAGAVHQPQLRPFNDFRPIFDGGATAVAEGIGEDVQVFGGDMLPAGQGVAVVGAEALKVPMAEVAVLEHVFAVEGGGRGGQIVPNDWVEAVRLAVLVNQIERLGLHFGKVGGVGWGWGCRYGRWRCCCN